MKSDSLLRFVIALMVAWFVSMVVCITFGQAAHPGYASAKIRIYDNGVSSVSGTAIAQGPAGVLILTCAHGFDDSSPDRVVVHQVTKKAIEGRLVAIDKRNDLALITYATTERIQLAPLGRRGIEPGEYAAVHGFGATYQAYGRAGKKSANGRSDTYNFPLRSGDSGCGVTDKYGQLVGVMWGSTRTSSRAVPLGTINRKMLEWTDVIRKTQCTGADCSPTTIDPITQVPPGGGGGATIQPATPTAPPVTIQPAITIPGGNNGGAIQIPITLTPPPTNGNFYTIPIQAYLLVPKLGATIQITPMSHRMAHPVETSDGAVLGAIRGKFDGAIIRAIIGHFVDPPTLPPLPGQPPTDLIPAPMRYRQMPHRARY